MIGVLVVNGLGYHDAPASRLLGTPVPPDSAAAQWVIGAVAALVQGKAYPMLAFLFGMALAYAARGLTAEPAAARTRRRAQRLLLLGVAHGLLLYFGDILTLYALVALSLATRVREPWGALRKRIARAFGWVAVAWLAGIWVASVGGRYADDATLGSVAGLPAFVALNATLYVGAQLSALLFAWPLVRLLMLLGIAATRLRLLTHARWCPLLQRTAARAAAPVLAANITYGALYLPLGDSPLGFAFEAASAMWCVPLAALYVAGAALAWQRGQRGWAHTLAPLGRRTLTLYVVASLAHLLLFSGAGLAWRPGSAQWLAFSMGLWGLAWLLARGSQRRWPLEAWMARR